MAEKSFFCPYCVKQIKADLIRGSEHSQEVQSDTRQAGRGEGEGGGGAPPSRRRAAHRRQDQHRQRRIDPGRPIQPQHQKVSRGNNKLLLLEMII